MTSNRNFTEAATYQWTAKSLKSIRESMIEARVHELLPTILSEEIEAGGLHSVAILADTKRMRRPTATNQETNVTVREDNTYYLPMSHNFEKQQAVEFLTPNYSIVPCVRPLEVHEWHSNKHLFSFYEVEIEMRSEKQEDAWKIAEKLLADVASSLEAAVKRGELPDHENGARNRNSVLKGKFPAISFAEALEKVGAAKDRVTDLTPEEDTLLCRQFETPFWIHDYPRPVRSTVFHENDFGRYESFDLMLPYGYGELATGGVRPKTGEQILRQSLDVIKEPASTLTRGHAEWKSSRQIQSTGFGIGLERLIRFMSGTNTILDIIQPHDRGPNRKLLTKTNK
ncbi:amino acid--tRNA ligase-related protein [Undibacterium sp. JH2W]|uniref:amino acid--tRNA ligase-related protein n=1 Tax=Undibacterium sp. JH2W TaxID=3413037 RepID=UPI003BF03E62